MTEPVPSKRTRATSFTNHAVNDPGTPLPGASVDAEIDGTNASLNDTIDFVRQAIDDDGRIKPAAADVGLIGATAIHLQDRSGDPKVRKLHELFIDIGAKDEASARARLNIGDPGTFLESSMMLSDELIVARALDKGHQERSCHQAICLHRHGERQRVRAVHRPAASDR